MEYITKKDLIDCSTPDEFCFSLCCMECKTVWKSTPIRFSKAGKKPENENRKIIYDTLYDREKNLAFQKALNQAKEIFNICLVLLYCMGVDGYKKEYTLLHKAFSNLITIIFFHLLLLITLFFEFSHYIIKCFF